MIEIKYAWLDKPQDWYADGETCPPSITWLHIELNNEAILDFMFDTRKDAEAELERIKRDGIKVWCAPAIH